MELNKVIILKTKKRDIVFFFCCVGEQITLAVQKIN